jgi:hypothetical protein
VDDGHLTVLVQPLEADHRRVEAEPIADLDHLAVGDPDVGPGAVVRRIAVRNERVQAVIAAGELDDDENALRMFLNARALQAWA